MTALTPRQAELVRAAATGETVPEIAARLFLSPNTVKTTLQNARLAVGVDSRAALLAWARDGGLG